MNYYPFSRYALYKSVQNALALVNNTFSDGCLCVSGSRVLCEVAGIENHKIIEMAYPQLDLGNINLPDESFSCIVSDFVIEHVEADPITMFSEQKRVITKGGFILCSSAFYYPYHAATKDLWRFSSDTYEYICKRLNLSILINDWWGSRMAMNMLIDGDSNINPEENKADLQLALHKEFHYPITTWLLAQRKHYE
jgi:hypothetical protein